MEPLAVILKRFMRLLPFLTAPNSYRRFHHELLYPYPDVWDGSDDGARVSLIPPPVQPARGRDKAYVSGRSRLLERPVGQHARPYLRWNERNESGLHRDEPFW